MRQPASLPTELNRDVAPTRALVQGPDREKPGTITIDTKNRYLYLSLEGGQAMRYDVGVGREGSAGRDAPVSAGAPNGRPGRRPPTC